MKILTPIIAVVLIATSPVLVAEERDEFGLREHLLNTMFASYASTGEVCYISFGSSPNTNLFQGASTNVLTSVTVLASPLAVHADPPQEFLTRFAGRPFVVKPASQYPKFKDRKLVYSKESPNGVPREFFSPLYTVEVLQWINDTTAKVRCSHHRAFTSATGYEAIVEKKDGKWNVKEIRGTEWIS